MYRVRIRHSGLGLLMDDQRGAKDAARCQGADLQSVSFARSATLLRLSLRTCTELPDFHRIVDW